MKQNQFQQITWKIKGEVVTEIMSPDRIVTILKYDKYFTNLYKHKEVLIPFEILC